MAARSLVGLGLFLKAKLTERPNGARFEAPSGDTWNMANISAPVFGSPAPKKLVKSLLARRSDTATGQPNP